MEALQAEERRRLVEELLRGAEPRPLEWRSLLARVTATRTRKRLRSGEEKTYATYKVTIPQELVEELGLEPGGLILLQAARPRWYHLLNYHDPDVQRTIWRSPLLPPYARAEICLLGGAPEELCRGYRLLPVIASEEELRELGLEPGQPITLRELLERARSATG